MHRFIGNFDFSHDTIDVGDPELLHQWLKVLRFGKGETLILADGKGTEVTATIEELMKSFAVLKIVSRQEVSREPKRRVHLYQALLKRENFEWVAQKAVEVGAYALQPLITDHTVKLGLRTDRVQKIMKEAAEQSGRTIVPRVQEPVSFAQALKQRDVKRPGVLFQMDAAPFSGAGEEMDIFIGPEGGWSAQELAMAKKHGLQTASLGKTVLRAETAATVATYLAAQG